MKTILFWTIWGIVSLLTLRTFYFSYTKEKLNYLRKTAQGLNLAIIISTFLPWLATSSGGKSGFSLVLEGNLLAITFLIFHFFSAVFSFSKRAILLKLLSITNFVAAIILFALMLKLHPLTFILTTYDIAPIIAIIFLLINSVIGILIWQQLELNDSKKVFK